MDDSRLAAFENAVLENLRHVLTIWRVQMEVGRETHFVRDLDFTSIDTVDFLALIESQFNTVLPFDKLLLNDSGEYRSDLTVRELSLFLMQNLADVNTGGKSI
jgi:acyl carrier protein